MLTPIEELEDLQFGLSSLVELHEQGSYTRELCSNAVRGLQGRLVWVIATLEAAKEGRKNMGLVSRLYVPSSRT